MAKRFSRLKHALKMFHPTSGNLTVPDTAPIRTFHEYMQGNLTRTAQQAITQPPRLQAKKISLNAFAYIPAKKFLVKVTGRTHAKLSGGSGNLGGTARYNWAADNTDAIENSSYDPAKAIIFQLAAQQAQTEVTSFYTGFKYNPLEGESFTVPFGEAATPAGEIGIQDDIVQALMADSGQKYVYTFKPEKMSRAN